MRAGITIAGVIVMTIGAAAPVRGDPARCGHGVDLLHHGDLPRAALYLDNCDGDDYAAAQRELHKRLDASDLAVVEIITRPAGLDAEIDALPGEHFTTPQTVWIVAGTYHVRVGALASTVATKPHARSVVYLDAAATSTTASAPKTGSADFSDEAEPAESGPPPDAQHGSMLPCKFAGTCATSGEQIADPLAVSALAAPMFPHVQLELRGGATDTNTSGLAPSLAFAASVRTPWQSPASTHPWSFEGRYAWDRRGGKDEWSGAEGIAKVIAAPDDAWLALGTAFGYSTFDGSMATVFGRLALRRLPIAVAATYEQAFSPLHDRAVIIELGIGLRR